MPRPLAFLGLLGLLVLIALGVAAVPDRDAVADGPADGAAVTGAMSTGSATGPGAAVPVTTSFRLPEMADGSDAGAPDPPIQLTASDGTGLTLVALEANGVLEPPLAFTELHLTFENPRDEVIEGRFRITLPPGAALSRFAMKIGGAWQEGEVVERQRARQAYEDFLHRRQDPALLEQESGNEFSARVFPIPARGQKELIVSYSHALEGADEPYVLPLEGLSQIGRLDVRVLLGERPAAESIGTSAKTGDGLGGEMRDRRVFELHKRDWTPDRDVLLRQDRLAERAGLRHGQLAVARLAAPVEARPQEIAGLYVLVDSSASRALGYAAQASRLADLLTGLSNGAGGDTPIGVAAFDQEVVSIYEGRADGFGREQARRLAARRPLGASDLHGALAWLADRLEDGPRTPRVLLVTDGVATAGETETAALKAAVRALRDRGVERLDVWAFGGLRDEAVLHQLTTGNLPHDGQRLDGAAPLVEIGRRLTLACRSGLEVKVEGAAWVWPETLDGVQPGDEVLVYADLPNLPAGRPLRLSVAGKPVALGQLAEAERPLLERAWVQARIDRLLHLRDTRHAGDADLRKALERQVAELSVQHRVLTPFTALLVLETEGDYVRFGLERRALADILTVGPGGLDVLARQRTTVLADRDIPAKERWLGRGNQAPPPPSPAAPRPEPATEPAWDEADVEEGVPAGVVGGVEGGVAGGVVGGVAGGVPGGVMSAEATQPVEVPPAIPPPPPIPADAPRRVADGEALAETITVAPEAQQDERRRQRVDDAEAKQRSRVSPYSGRFGGVMDLLVAGRVAQARAAAEAWNTEAPGDVLALLALGEALEAAGQATAAARAYGSLIDLFPSRADLRRLAGERLERLGEAGLALAVDTYRKAVEQRPDHPSGHRLLAWALLRAGRPEEAFAALEKGLVQRYPGGRFRGVDQILREDLGLLAAAWLREEPARRGELRERLEAQNAALAGEPSLRFVLTWETDANDVDLHIHDRRGGHAYFSHPALPSGGRLIADVTTGYGPECFAVDDPDGSAAPYRLEAHYYRRGPMGYGMGLLQVVRHDGAGRFTVEPRPFVVMADNATVDFGEVDGKAPRLGK